MFTTNSLPIALEYDAINTRVLGKNTDRVNIILTANEVGYRKKMRIVASPCTLSHVSLKSRVIALLQGQSKIPIKIRHHNLRLTSEYVTVMCGPRHRNPGAHFYFI